MADERNIEQLLRKAAERRRAEAGAPFELHPVNRRLLQAEVAQRFPQATRAGGWFRSLRFTWPRLAWALGVATVIGFVALQLMPPGRKAGQMELAASREAREAPELSRDADLSPSMPTTVTAPETTRLAGELALQKEKLTSGSGGALPGAGAPGLRSVQPDSSANSLADAAVPAEKTLTRSAPAPSTRSAQKPKAATEGVAAANNSEPWPPPTELATRGLGADPAPATAAPEEATFRNRYGLAGSQPGAPSVAMRGGSRGGETTRTSKTEAPVPSSAAAPPALAVNQALSVQRFARVDELAQRQNTRAETAPVAAQVLNDFAVEQIGDQVQFVDADGSIYKGSLQVAEVLTDQPLAAGTALSAGEDLRPAQNVRGETKAKGAEAASGIQAPTEPMATLVQNYSFQVEGTNRSLNQRVVFTGNLVSFLNDSGQVTNALPLGTGAVAQVQNSLRDQQPILSNRVQSNVQSMDRSQALLRQQLQNNLNYFNNQTPARISGRARVGEDREFHIDALPQQK